MAESDGAGTGTQFNLPFACAPSVVRPQRGAPQQQKQRQLLGVSHAKQQPKQQQQQQQQAAGARQPAAAWPPLATHCNVCGNLPAPGKQLQYAKVGAGAPSSEVAQAYSACSLGCLALSTARAALPQVAAAWPCCTLS